MINEGDNTDTAAPFNGPRSNANERPRNVVNYPGNARNNTQSSRAPNTQQAPPPPHSFAFEQNSTSSSLPIPSFGTQLNQEEADEEYARKIMEQEMLNERNNTAAAPSATRYPREETYRPSSYAPIVDAQPLPPHSFARNSDSGPSSSPFPIPSFAPPTHMCLIPCEMGKGVCVEMLVDTGAQSSVISYSLAQRLNITNRLDTSHQGVAAGVGRARIIGKLRNIACIMGHVEFAMDFIVLDVQDQLLLLGLDQMRKYKCIVDLERELLIFGGSGGVEVPLLPADQVHINIRNSLSQLGCPMM